MQSKTGLILPGIFRGNDFQEGFLQAAEPPLFHAEHEIQAFIDNLALPLFNGSNGLIKNSSNGLSSSCIGWVDWLFYALGAEKYLRDDFNSVQKRNVLMRLFEMYRTKGTVQGLRLHWEVLADMEMFDFRQPPDKSFNSPSLTEQERALWEQKHPEIRIYPFAAKGWKGKAMFASDCIGWGHPSITDAGARLADRVELYDPLTCSKTLLNSFYIDAAYALRRLKNVIEVRLKGKAYGIFLLISSNSSSSSSGLNSSNGSKCLVDHEAGKRLYNIQLYAEAHETINVRKQLSIKPTLQPMRGYYELEYIHGKRTGISLTNRYTDIYKDRGGSYLSGAYAAQSDARQRIMKKMRLYDPVRVSFFERESFNYLNDMKIGRLGAHHAEAYVDMIAYAPKRAAYFASHMNEHLCASDAGQRIQKMLWAGNLARQAGCKASVSITNRKPVKTGMGTLCGRHRSGQYIRQ